jgi:acyl-CoA reductase-like NAD-dependent aldehyde dehydrogenase
MREIMQMQVALVDEYKRAYGLFRRDKHFTAEELRYMQRVYTGILEESVKSLDQILLVVNAFSTQMSDAQRLQIINAAADAIEKNARDLRQFNAQNIRLSLARAGDQRELERVQQLYGLSILP